MTVRLILTVVLAAGGWLLRPSVDFCVPGESGCELTSVSNALDP